MKIIYYFLISSALLTLMGCKKIDTCNDDYPKKTVMDAISNYTNKLLDTYPAEGRAELDTHHGVANFTRIKTLNENEKNGSYECSGVYSMAYSDGYVQNTEINYYLTHLDDSNTTEVKILDQNLNNASYITFNRTTFIVNTKKSNEQAEKYQKINACVKAKEEAYVKEHKFTDVSYKNDESYGNYLKKWDSDCTIDSSISPKTETTPPDINVDKCVDEKIAAYRKEQGQDAIVMNDQQEEWESQCKSNK